MSGRNWGDAVVDKSSLVFRVDKKTAFNIAIPDVSQVGIYSRTLPAPTGRVPGSCPSAGTRSRCWTCNFCVAGKPITLYERRPSQRLHIQQLKLISKTTND